MTTIEKPRWIGIIPAAGEARRLALGAYPKEMLPILFSPDGPDRIIPMLAIERSAALLIQAGVDLIVVVMNDRKLELLRVLGDGAAYGRPIVYVQQPRADGLGDAVRRAAVPFPDCHALLSLPDSLFRPTDAVQRLKRRLQQGGADVALAVFPTGLPETLAPVLFEEGRATAVLEKPQVPPADNTWGLAAWTPRFTADLPDLLRDADQPSPSITTAFAEAIRRGYHVAVEDFPEGRYYDLGTPAGISDAFRHGGAPLWVDDPEG